jgi:hypothetical protein
VNGALSGSNSNVFDSSTINTTRLYNYFGRSHHNGYVAFVHLDEIKIYNKALTLDQVKLDMNTVGIPTSGIC